ncbi:Periplasmic solute binding protein [Bradyrhizobium vignae]|uniref:Periplasmic solute binding protein n=2 Tax=Nitrobacteraceae TaxID=41294 RepID=A0A2U3Q6X6_9BRAD|nr:Periplasmic solute binding protein [Bradyrhizobium vignae]
MVMASRARLIAIVALCVMTASMHAAFASTRIVVVATTSDVASLASAVGGDVIEVKTIVPPGTDPEPFEPRVSDLSTLSDADLIVRVGLGYDLWIDKLIIQLHRPEFQAGGGRLVDASIGVPLLEARGRTPVTEDGHAHGLGNPHYWLDPANAETVTATIAERIIRLMPAARDTIVANRNRFLATLHERIVAWMQRLAPYRGASLVAYHNSWPYFARRFHLNLVGFIETKEGVAPSVAHLSSLIAEMGQNGVRAILQEAYEPKNFSEMLSARTGAPLVVLAPTVGSVPEARDYLSLMDFNVGALARTLATGSH